MPDHKCNICCRNFQSPSHLKRHYENKIKCKPVPINMEPIKKDNNEIVKVVTELINSQTFNKDTLMLIKALIEDKEQYFDDIDIINKNMHKCIDCGIIFAQRQGLYRHNKLNRCRVKKQGVSMNDLIEASVSDDDDASVKADNVTVNITKNANSNINNSTIENSNIDLSNTTNHNVYNNNITINVQPFGLESLEHITLKDFKNIFSDTETLMDKLCNHVFTKHLPNISFYKYNLNKQIISFLSKNMEIERIDEKDFIVQFKKLLEDMCILLFYQYREHLNRDELINYMKKLVEYQDSVLYENDGTMNKNTKSCILRLMDFAFRNKDIKYSIEKIISDLKNNLDSKNKLLDKFNSEEDKRDDIINEFYYRGRNKNNTEGETGGNTKLLYKIRNKAIESKKKDDQNRYKQSISKTLDNVKFSTTNDDDE